MFLGPTLSLGNPPQADSPAFLFMPRNIAAENPGILWLPITHAGYNSARNANKNPLVRCREYSPNNSMHLIFICVPQNLMYLPSIIHGKDFLYMCVCSVMSLFATLWTVAHQAHLSVGFPRQKYRSGLPFPPPGALPDPGIEPVTPVSPALAGGFFNTEPPGKPWRIKYINSYLFHTSSA